MCCMIAYSIVMRESRNFTSFECASLKLRTIGKSIRLLLVYRKQEVAFLTFGDEVVSLIERYIMDTAKHVLLGDFNLHINELADSNADTCCDLLECYNPKNNIFFPTHTSNNTLDLDLNASDDITVKAFQQGELISDHYVVHFDIMVERGLVNSKLKQYHKFRSIELDALKNDLREHFANRVQERNDLDGMLAVYFEGIKGVVDKHTPLKRCRATNKPQKNLGLQIG